MTLIVQHNLNIQRLYSNISIFFFQEISECKSVLDSEADVGMNGPLIDNEGYPRNDIDIVKVRTARQKIICLMNDHKEIMKKISDALESIHQQNSNGTGNHHRKIC